LRVDVAQVLEYTELITGLSTRGLGDVVERGDTSWSDSILADLEFRESKKFAEEHWKWLEERWELARFAIGDTERSLVEGVLDAYRLTLPGRRIELDAWCDVIDVLM